MAEERATSSRTLQQAAVAAAFISPNGLVITNHHVGADALQKLSTSDRDLLAKGFLAKTRDEEIKCVDLELNVLVSTEECHQASQCRGEIGNERCRG